MKINKDLKKEISLIIRGIYLNGIMTGIQNEKVNEKVWERAENEIFALLDTQKQDLKEMIEGIDATTTEQEPVKSVLKHILKEIENL